MLLPIGMPYRPDSSCSFNLAPLVNGNPNFTTFYNNIQQLGNTPPFYDDYWGFIDRLSKDSVIMKYAPYTGQSGPLIAPLTAALLDFSNDSLMGAFYDTWSPARQMMMQTNTTPVLLEVLYNANPGGLLSGYISGVTGGLDTVKKALAGIPWLTAEIYLSDASTLLTGYVVGPAVLANTLRYHKFALGAHHIYGSSRLGTKDYLPGQYYRTRDYTGPMPVFDTLTLTTRKPWYSLEYNDAISSLSLSPYGNTQKGKYFLDRLIGMKQYELTNHLGNVQATVTDYPVAVIKGLQGNTIGFRRPALATAYDYYPFGMLMPGRYVSDTTSKCVTITQTKWTQNWNIKIYAYADWVWPGLTLAGGATATASQIVTTTMPVNGSVSFTFEAAPTLENQAQLNIASLSGKPRISIYETLATGTEVELTSIMPQAAGTFNLTYTPSTSSIKVKILGTGTTTSSINWGNLQIWKPEMIQTDVLVDICEKDNDRYVYGFNGQLKDNEWAGIGNSLAFENRVYDSRVAKFLSIDREFEDYPAISPYAFAGNNPILFIDENGDGPKELTTAEFRKVANELGVKGNKRIGELFERIAMASVQTHYVIANSKLNFFSPARSKMNAGTGKSVSVRPDGIQYQVEGDLSKGVKGAKISFNPHWYEAKATTALITKKYRSGQIMGMIDALAYETKNHSVKHGTLTLLTTGDTRVSKEILEYAVSKNVDIWQSKIGMDEDGFMNFSDPENLTKDYYGPVSGAINRVLEAFDAADGDNYETFKDVDPKNHTNGLTSKQAGTEDTNSSTPGMASDPDPEMIDDK